jgi:hypothetical protein
MAAHAAIAVGWSVVEVRAKRLCRIAALAWPEVERYPAIADRVPPCRMPITDQLHPVAVAPVDQRAHNPG